MSLLTKLSLRTTKGWNTRYQLAGSLNFRDISSRIYSVNLNISDTTFFVPIGCGLAVHFLSTLLNFISVVLISVIERKLQIKKIIKPSDGQV